jgi:hypothetical protein
MDLTDVLENKTHRKALLPQRDTSISTRATQRGIERLGHNPYTAGRPQYKQTLCVYILRSLASSQSMNADSMAAKCP